ncbi:leukotriene B4 receptor 2b [Hypomesus transpacificus]|uniref:leukotriene B4 receptor 2b n=1 Tax=Hypomesus transpacificus TaxID=137520 RepID=UPI001F07657B|nr:leukotriene B4 receptor 2b [Hypomesus transpacificus]
MDNDSVLAFRHALSGNGNDTGEDIEDESGVSNDTTTVVGALILSLVFLLGVPGNAFIIWSILARAHKRSVTTLIILNLACADGCLMLLTVFFVVYLARQNWDFGNPMCKGVFYLCNLNMFASIFLITLMSLHRLVAVVWPRKVHKLASRKIVLRVLAGVWFLVIFTSIPALVFREVREVTDDMNETRLVCAPHHTLRRHVRFQYTFETVLGFLLPYGIIVTSYICILRRLRQTKFRRQVRSEKLILAIVVMFGIFWLPYHVINMMQVAAQYFKEGSDIHKTLDQISSDSRPVTSSLAFISSCANPVLYTFAGKAYIKKDGLAFMARLFEGTSLETAVKKGRIKSTRKDQIRVQTMESSISDDGNTANESPASQRREHRMTEAP